jgi:hypothetical protein
MSDPADKSDDLIAELAKLMASTPASNAPAAQPASRPVPLTPTPSAAPPVQSAAPTPFRIPGMDAPVIPRAVPPQQAAPTPAPQPEVRAPSTGSIRIPGMDQPAPVSTSAPVGKFDFGGKPAVTPIQQEPLSTFTDRLAAGRNLANDPAPRVEPAMTPIRIPSDLKPVSENRSFAEGPALAVDRPTPVAPPVQTAAEGGDFHFDFGFGENPPEASPPLRPAQHPVAAQPQSVDPIAALIEADLAEGPEAEPFENLEPVEDYTPAPEPVRPSVPVARTNAQGAQPQMAPAQPRPPSAPIPLKPVSAAPRAPDNDRFAVAPNVGVSMRPPAGQPLRPQARAPEPAAPEYDDSDPMSEIESLIGEAVRVELTPGPVRVQTPQQVAPKVQLERDDDLAREIHAEPPQQRNAAPVVPPLTTAFAPRRTNIKEDKTNAASAEDAILAAAAASGAEVGRIEPAVGDDSPYRRLKVKPQRSSFLSGGMRQYVGMAVAGTLLLAAGLGLYWVLNMGRTADAGANAPQLTADATPVKVLPAPSTAPPTDAAKSPVLAKMEGASAAPSQEQLVSTDETSGGTVTRDVTPAAGTDDENGLSNRKVRTVTVRPDGTIVSGDDAVAGGAELPIDRPNVPAVPSTETTNLLGNTDTQTADATASDDPTTTATTAADATQVATIDPSVVAPTPMSFPVRTQTLGFAKQPANSTVNALAPPANSQQSVDLLGDSADPQVATNTAPKRPTLLAPPAAAPAAATSGGNAPAYVQLSSQPSQELAQASARSVASRFGSLFGGSKLVITPATVDGKGTMYRVRLPASSLADAGNICAQIKGQGGDCFATKG